MNNQHDLDRRFVEALWGNPVRGSCTELVWQLLGQGANVHTADRRGRTVLSFRHLERYGVLRVQVARSLVESYGADVNGLVDNRGTTPLLEAARFNAMDLFEFFLEKGADMNHRDNHGRTVLHLAALHPTDDAAVEQVLAVVPSDMIFRKNRKGETAGEQTRDPPINAKLRNTMALVRACQSKFEFAQVD